jgi:hypothetical protein
MHERLYQDDTLTRTVNKNSSRCPIVTCVTHRRKIGRKNFFLYNRARKRECHDFSEKQARNMGNLRKKRRRKIAQHKRRKRSRSNRHKKRLWGA